MSREGGQGLTKQELQEYYWVKRNIKRLEERLEELKAEATRRTAVFTQGAKSQGYKDRMASIVAGIVTVREKILEELIRSYEILTKVEQAVESLPPREKYLIRARYIDCKSWEQIAVEMNYSWRQVHYLHANALKLLSSADHCTQLHTGS